MKETEPKPKCEIDSKCQSDLEYWLIDQKEDSKFRACRGHKDQYLSERFKAERIIAETGPLLHSITPLDRTIGKL